jgi:hypothetical protein
MNLIRPVPDARARSEGLCVLLSCAAALLLFLLPRSTPAQDSASAPAVIDFDHDIRPILADHCFKCHSAKKQRSGLRLDSREAILRGGKSGPAAVPGDAAGSLLIQLVSGEDPDRQMPDDADPLAAPEIDFLRRWIDEGLVWGTPIPADTPHKYDLALHPVTIPQGPWENPIDRLLGSYFQQNNIDPPAPIDDRTFARRAFLDTIGLLPAPSELSAFLVDPSPKKRTTLIRSLLADHRRYAEHWLTFWNDALRNDYAGTGYIDGGREQITQWLFTALDTNLPYDRFVSELINPPTPASEGFTKGIIWRGVVNASQVPPMQAAQNVSQVFLGLNLKCNSCHDSFISDWKLSDAYNLAAVFADTPLEINRCDRPQGTIATPAFLYPELGAIPADADRAARLAQLSALITKRDNGRFSRTIVNRLWSNLFGRGLIDPPDEMDNPPWSADLLDFLAADLADHDFDLKHTLELILTSRAYQTQSQPAPERLDPSAPFEGPLVRRMTAEQFSDAVRTLTGVWPAKPDAQINIPGSPDGSPWPGPARAALMKTDPLLMSLGRPNREQVVTTRASAATTLEAVELTNGATLDAIIKQGAQSILAEGAADAASLVNSLYLRALGRDPTPAELSESLTLLGSPTTVGGVQDLLWTLTVLPEFQLIE